MMKDRRRRRGDTLLEALSFQLAACVEDEGLSAMVLADSDGLCLASWGEREICDLAAAMAPLGEAVRVKFGATDLFLSAIGGEPRARDRSLSRSATAVPRILERWIVAEL